MCLNFDVTLRWAADVTVNVLAVVWHHNGPKTKTAEYKDYVNERG